jgi:O-antigen/teichoic acid export membrane protein
MRGVFKNIFANWVGLLATAIAGFFLTPFVLHHLGNTGFGLWVLASTLTGYYGLFDFGLRSATTRYIARYAAIQDWENLRAVLNTTFIAYSGIGLLTVVITTCVAWKFDVFFHVAPEWTKSAGLLILVFGYGTAIAIPFSLFGGVLEALQRFTWVGGVQAVGALLRATLVVLFLSHGGGLLSLGWITVVINLSSYLVYMIVAFRICPELHFGWRYARMSSFRILARFGVIVFWISIAQQLRFQTDAVVIGSFLTVEAIAIFSIGSKLVAYATDGVQALATVFTPMASHFDAREDLHELRRVLIVGNRYSSLVIFPITAIFLVLGKTMIRVWVGPAYLSAFPVLAILIVPTALYLAQAASPKVLYGMARHSKLAIVLFLEGVANLILSIVLARRLGINGVALGTAIPMACTSLVFLPIHLCRTLDLRLRDYLRTTYSYPLLLCVPVIPVLWAADRWIGAQTYTQLLLVLCMGALAYAPGVASYFYWKERPEMIRNARMAEPVGTFPSD